MKSLVLFFLFVNLSYCKDFTVKALYLDEVAFIADISGIDIKVSLRGCTPIKSKINVINWVIKNKSSGVLEFENLHNKNGSIHADIYFNNKSLLKILKLKGLCE